METPEQLVVPETLSSIEVEELPEEIQETIVIVKGVTKKQIKRKPIIKKRSSTKEETTKILTVEEKEKPP